MLEIWLELLFFVVESLWVESLGCVSAHRGLVRGEEPLPGYLMSGRYVDGRWGTNADFVSWEDQCRMRRDSCDCSCCPA